MTQQVNYTANYDNLKDKTDKSAVVMPVVASGPETIQSAIIVAMQDLVKHADDVIWLTEIETVFERLWALHSLAGGKDETLHKIFPGHE